MEILILLLILGAVATAAVMFSRKGPAARAEQLEVEGRTVEALEEYKKILLSNPEDINIMFRIASLYMGRAQYADALVFLNKALELNRFEHELQREQVQRDAAVCAFHIRDYYTAFIGFQELEANKLMDANSNYYMGVICLKMGALQEAYGYLEKAYNALRNFYALTYTFAIASARLGKHEQALKLLREASDQKPGEIRVPLMASMVSLLSQQPAYTTEYADQVLRHEAIDDNLRYLAQRIKAFSLINLGKLQEAEPLFQGLLTFTQEKGLEKAEQEARYDLGFLYVHLDRKPEALEQWQALAQINPDFPLLTRLMKLTHKEISEESTAISKHEEWNPRLEDEGNTPEEAVYLIDYLNDWKENALSIHTLWAYSGLREEKKFDIYAVMEQTGHKKESDTRARTEYMGNAIFQAFLDSDQNSFEQIGKRIVAALGYKIVQRVNRIDMGEFLEGSGLDFIVVPSQISGEKILLQLRKWRTGKMGDVPLKNLAGRMGELKCKKGVFVTTAQFSPAAIQYGENNANLRIINGDELKTVLATIL